MGDNLAATRAMYDTVAVAYGELVTGLNPESGLEGGMLAAFADRVRGTGRVLDAGCGTGRMTAWLASVGIVADGIDLSPGMIEVARRTYPDLSFDVGSMTALDLPGECVSGILAWYSIIHTSPADLPAVVAELARVLAPGGHLLLGWHSGDDAVRTMTHAYGHDVSADAYRHAPESVAAAVHAAGLVVSARLVREPQPDREKSPQASLLARRPC
ncbi:class I SAM-dependent DNA methyltransferase [Cellulomonas sp. P5_C6]